jgi:hypothetical protein
MGLNDEHQVFLSQEDHNDDEIQQFQTRTSESFDFKQGYDTAVYEVHKQYKLRSRTINVTQPEKTKDSQQPKRAIVTEPNDTTDTVTNEITVQEVTEPLPSKQQPMATSPLQPNPSNTSQEMSKKDKPQDQDKNQEENLVNKEKAATHNTKIQS